jgi:hypothetical protein
MAPSRTTERVHMTTFYPKEVSGTTQGVGFNDFSHAISF